MAAPLDLISLTRRLLSFHTVNPPGQERECAEYLGRLLEQGGLEVASYEFEQGRTSLIARLQGSGDLDPICYSGHIDTIPVGTGPWSKDPFSGEVDGDRLFGRGASDMKSGVSAMVSAALSLADISSRKAGLTLVLTAGEETGSQGASHLAGLGGVLGRAGALVVGEPTSNYPLVGHKGSLWLEARTTGVTAHGSMLEQGDNAIYKAVRAVTGLQGYGFNIPPHPLLGSPTLNVGTIAGGVNINSVPDRAVIGVDIRTIPGLPHNELIKDLQSHLGEEVDISPVMDVESVATDPENEWVREVFELVEPFIKERPKPRGATYFTDASILTPAFGRPPTIILGPGQPEMAHKTDEFCLVSRIEQAAEIYFEIARKWCLV